MIFVQIPHPNFRTLHTLHHLVKVSAKQDGGLDVHTHRQGWAHQQAPQEAESRRSSFSSSESLDEDVG